MDLDSRLSICNIPFLPAHIFSPPEVYRVPLPSFDIEVCRLLCSILSCILGNDVGKAELFPHTALESLYKESQMGVHFHIFWSSILVDFL